jgi:hypothetical protein
LTIFKDTAPPRDVWLEDARWPWRRTETLCCRFTDAFPQVRYEVLWETRRANAQAFLGPYGKTVRIYGGLARNKRIGVAGLALTLAHETGHHLADGARHPFYISLASEERAHEWAIEEGLPKVFGPLVSARYSREGRRQLKAIWRVYVRPDSIDPFPRKSA